jgi:hypothetical protein
VEDVISVILGSLDLLVVQNRGSHFRKCYGITILTSSPGYHVIDIGPLRVIRNYNCNMSSIFEMAIFCTMTKITDIGIKPSLYAKFGFLFDFFLSFFLLFFLSLVLSFVHSFLTYLLTYY